METRTMRCVRCLCKREVEAEKVVEGVVMAWKGQCPECGTTLRQMAGRKPLYGRKLTTEEIWRRQHARRKEAKRQRIQKAIEATNALPKIRVCVLPIDE